MNEFINILWGSFIEGFAGYPLRGGIAIVVLGTTGWWLYTSAIGTPPTDLNDQSNYWRYLWFVFLTLSLGGAYNCITGLFKSSYQSEEYKK